MTLDDHIAFVNEISASFRAVKSRPENPAPVRERYQKWWMRASALAEYLHEQKKLEAPLSPELGDVSDLPAELLAELSAPQLDELERQIVTVLKACPDEVADLDQILVGLFRKFQILQKRRFVQNKLWRMSKKNLVWGIPNKRGHYTLGPLVDGPPETQEMLPLRNGSAADDDDDIPF